MPAEQIVNGLHDSFLTMKTFLLKLDLQPKTFVARMRKPCQDFIAACIPLGRFTFQFPMTAVTGAESDIQFKI